MGINLFDRYAARSHINQVILSGLGSLSHSCDALPFLTRRAAASICLLSLELSGMTADHSSGQPAGNSR
jgi:hypothetical protein